MKVITDTKQKMTNALMHYFCLRFQFRSGVVAQSSSLPSSSPDKRYQDFCLAKH
jgi:hypothetical protein